MIPDILGEITFNWSFIAGLLSIIVIDLVLAGDNAVVIAMAARSLPAHQRKKIIILGAAAAVILRIVFTFFVAQLLHISFIKLVGGILILWIALRLFVDGAPDETLPKKAASMGQAIRLILIADISMSLDNMLAVAAASQGNFFLLCFGLALSIPLVVFTSNLLAILMDRYPIIIYTGAAILGKVGGYMIITDPFVVRLLEPSKMMEYALQATLAAAVIIAGKLWVYRMVKKQKAQTSSTRQQPSCEISS